MRNDSFNNKKLKNQIKPRRRMEERVCKNCGRRILHNPDPEANLCPMCKEQELFYEVKDYIRANDDVKDYDVAKKFGIPLAKVNEWIRQGRIQYKDDPTMKNVIMGNYCQICGSPLSFGSVCPACVKLKKKGEIKGVAIAQPGQDSSKMRFIDKDGK